VEVVKGQLLKNVDLRLVRGGLITGRVSYQDTGEPVSNYWITIRDSADPGSFTQRKTITNAAGFYQIRAAPGKAIVSIPGSESEGYAYSLELRKVLDIDDKRTLSGVDFQIHRLYAWSSFRLFNFHK
jgi:hypothetical protein